MIDKNLKKIIFKKLYKDLSNVEIIPNKESIWFIDRDKKYWYFELQNNQRLWWRYDFFENFFSAFSLNRDDYESIIKDWVKEVLNNNVVKTYYSRRFHDDMVKDVLNIKTEKTSWSGSILSVSVKDLLNCKMVTTWVKEILNNNIAT